ncbi:MAG: SRPBCC domain-containing protein [Phormidesmis sp.]
MPTLYAEIDINAPQSVVWNTLIRKDQWRFWNTFLYDCDPGLPIARGNEIYLSMQRLEGDEETEFQPLITMLRPPMMMRWTSTIPGLRSEHIFELRETVPGRTRYLHRETFSGVLSKVFLPFIRQDERQGLRRMAQQLKMHVENNVLGNNPPPQDRYYPPQRGGYYDPGYDDRRYGGGGYNRPPQRGYDRPDDGRPDYGRPDYDRPDYGRDYPPNDYPPNNYPPNNYPPNDYPPGYGDRPRRRR